MSTTTAGAAISATTTAPGLVEPEPCLVLGRVGWDQYIAISEALGERAGLRLIFVEGRLTLLSPSRRHDWHSGMLGHLIIVIARGSGISWELAGSSTFRSEGLEVGVEGDQTYYFGEHAGMMRGPRNIDLSTQPPPDLAIEVEVTHPAHDAMLVYARLRVPEVWRLDVRRDSLTFWLRQDDGAYVSGERSAAFPFLEPGDVLGQLRLAEQLGASAWDERLGAWVQDVLIPRRGGGA